MPWDIILTIFIGVFALMAFGAAIQRRSRGGDLLSVSFFLAVSALAVVVTIYRLQAYWAQPPAPTPAAVATIATPGGTPPPMPPGPHEATVAQLVAGRAVAQHHCANCHQVAPDLPVPPLVNTGTGASVAAPSFAAIAHDPKTSDASLRAFLTLPHYPMLDQSTTVKSDELPYLTAYILSLRNAAGAAR
jgi:mono/diheme cytochrome c family protein